MQNIYKCIFVSILSLSLVQGFGQNVKRGFKSLEKSEFDKAKEIFEKALEDNLADPAANFGMAYIYANDNYPEANPLRAWRYVDEADRNFKNISADDSEVLAEFFLAMEVRKTSRPVAKKFQIYRDDIKNKLIKFMREENNLEVVNNFLNEFKEFEHYDNIVHIRNYIEYRNAENENTLEAFNLFLKKYPNAAQRKLAIEKRNELAFMQAKSQNTIQAYENFMQEYPDAVQLAEAEMLRNKLEFDRVQKINTYEAYQQFIQQYPNSIHIPKAKELQKQVVYQRAKTINTLEAYNEFIRMYPDGAQFIDIFNLKANELGRKYKENNPFLAPKMLQVKGFDYEQRSNTGGDLAATSDGKVVIAGSVPQDDTSSVSDAWIILLDQNGKMVWNKTVGEWKEDRANHLVINSRGDLVIGGYTGASRDTMDGRAWLFKLTGEGKKIWNKTLNIPEIKALNINSIDQLIIGGYRLNDSADYEYALYKLTREGKKFWERKYTIKGIIHDIEVDENNEIIVVGGKWVWKLDDDGYILWEYFPQVGDSILCTDIAPSGKIILGGQRNQSECLLVMLDPQGRELWNQAYASEISGCSVNNILMPDENKIQMYLRIGDHVKLVQANNAGEIISESDLHKDYTRKINAMKSAPGGNIIVLTTVYNLGQEEDMLYMMLSE